MIIPKNLNYVANPIIGHPMWLSAITEEHKKRIMVERVKLQAELKGKKITEATDYEAMIYIMTASFTAPLSHSFYKIYVYLFRKFYSKQSKHVFQDQEGAELSYTEKQDLQRLKEWLLKVQVKETRGKKQ